MGKKPQMKYDNPSSIKGLQEIFKERYEQTHDPLTLMTAFCHAREYGIQIPEWILDALQTAFAAYLEGNPPVTLDSILGLTNGPGQDTAREVNQDYARDVEIMTGIDALVRQLKIKVVHAVKIVIEHNRNLKPLSFETTRQGYYRWRKKLSRITEYDDHTIQELKNSTPEYIRKKYPAIFNL